MKFAMNPIIERIEKELNKTFESISEKWVKTSSILKKLNLQLVEQRQSKFSPESLIKLYLYRRIKGIYCYKKLLEKPIFLRSSNVIVFSIRL